jgi:hypothetical protein
MSVPELPLAVRSFWPGVDLGLEAHYVPIDRVPVEAWARVGEGLGSRRHDSVHPTGHESVGCP